MSGDRKGAALSSQVTSDLEVSLTEALLAEREQAKFLAEASRTLAGSLNLDRTVLRVLHLVVPKFAYWAQVILVDARTIHATALSASDPARGLQREWARRPSEAQGSGLTRVLRTGRRELIEPVDEDLLDALVPHPELRATVDPLLPSAALTIPLRAHGRVFGAMTLLRGDASRPFESGEVSTLEDLAQRAALAVDAAQRHWERSHVAEVLQASLRPPTLPEVPGVRLAAYYRPAQQTSEVGGDFYDVHGDGDDWSIVIGDVCGKGVEAAVLTGQARHAIRAVGLIDRRPSRILALLNTLLLTSDGSTFATVICGRVRPDGEGGIRFDVASAGHPPPLLLRADGRTETVPVKGIVVGMFPDREYDEVSVQMGPGDVCLLYTDGITEARGEGGELLGADRVMELLRDCAGAVPQAVIDYIAHSTLEYLRGRAHDDLAMLALKVQP